MQANLSKRIPEGEWSSFNEYVGTGNGEKTEFLLPFPAKEARGLLMMRGIGIFLPDGKRVEGSGEKAIEVPDGYHLKETSDGGLKLIFDSPPIQGVNVGACVFGRKVGLALKVLPFSTSVQKALDDATPKTLKISGKTLSDEESRQLSVLRFHVLVVDWTRKDEQGNPVPCDEEQKRIFLDEFDVHLFGAWALARAWALSVERVNALGVDSGN